MGASTDQLPKHPLCRCNSHVTFGSSHISRSGGYHRCDAATAVRTSSRSARVERVPAASRQALSMCASRAPALRAYLDGLCILYQQFLLLVIGNHARSASRISPSTRAQTGVGTRAALVREVRVVASAAGHGERCGTRPRARRVYVGPEWARGRVIAAHV